MRMSFSKLLTFWIRESVTVSTSMLTGFSTAMSLRKIVLEKLGFCVWSEEEEEEEERLKPNTAVFSCL